MVKTKLNSVKSFIDDHRKQETTDGMYQVHHCQGNSQNARRGIRMINKRFGGWSRNLKARIKQCRMTTMQFSMLQVLFRFNSQVVQGISSKFPSVISMALTKGKARIRVMRKQYYLNKMPYNLFIPHWSGFKFLQGNPKANSQRLSYERLQWKLSGPGFTGQG